MSIKRVVILCPQNVRTGGPEACFQLSDTLINLGFECKLWLLNQSDFQQLFTIASSKQSLCSLFISLPKRENSIEEYFCYNYEYFADWQDISNTVFVVPEAYAWSIPLFKGSNLIFWWLSFDNALHSLSQINLNYLRQDYVRHACQSYYSARVVSSITQRSVSMLTDYTIVPTEVKERILDLELRPKKILINGSHKIIFDLEKIVARLRDISSNTIECVILKNLPREEVYNQMMTSRVFLDLASFPGKDRMPREAILCGSLTVLAAAGAASNSFGFDDFPLPDVFFWNMVDINTLCEKLLWMINDPKRYESYLYSYSNSISSEKLIFEAEVASLFGGFVEKVNKNG